MRNRAHGRKLLVGVFFSLVLIEGALQLLGFLTAARLADNRTVSEEDIVILALGESTTAPAEGQDWPAQLEEILATQYPQRTITVINKGVIGTNTNVILGRLEEYLAAYRPTIVIAMIGINDLYLTQNTQTEFIPDTSLFPNRKWGWLENLKLSKLATLVFRTLAIAWQETTVNYLRTDAEGLYEEALQFVGEGNLLLAEQYLRRAIDLSPQEPSYKISLSWVYVDTDRLHEAEPLLQAAIADQPNDVHGHVHLAILHHSQGELQKSYSKFQEISRQFPGNSWVNLEFGRLLSTMVKLDEAEQHYLYAAGLDPTNPSPFIEVAHIYRTRGELIRAKLMYQRALDRDPANERARLELATLQRMEGFGAATEATASSVPEMPAEVNTNFEDYYHPETVKNYGKLLAAAGEHSFHFIAVQYPLRPVEPLQDLIESVRHSHTNPDLEIEVVGNADTFRTALQSHSYDELFIDRFGGDFGHTTALGGQILAENIAQTVAQVLGF